MTEHGTVGMSRALKWLFGGDTGLSSECVWRQMTGTPEPDDWFRAHAHPHDPDDLGRIVRLLDRFPEWGPRIGEMREHSPEWAALAECWDEIVALYREESPSGRAPRCYDRMREAIDAARKATTP